MTIQVKTPTGEGTMKLTWVAYIPGFFTSVVGLLRSRSLSIHFDLGSVSEEGLERGLLTPVQGRALAR